ncbi:family 43 glycosylhydrolase [Solicola sp. PLA-1-18]|uniref:family 43 glycosylhydrolase n=1 Tax=Solicola sp. PLA-1-18 TaxID=3380532 RepID=UPI003B810E66
MGAAVLATVMTAGVTSASASTTERQAAALTAPTTKLAVPNPSLIKTPAGWVMLNTGNAKKPGLISRAPALGGKWRRDKQFALLSKKPKWAEGVGGVWAPSIVQEPSGRYVVFYSAPVKGKDHRRCIGTGYTTGASLTDSVASAGRPKALFKPRNKPLVCFSGSGVRAADVVSSKTAGSIIDATPAVVDGRYYLTYKTEKRRGGKWLTTTRLLPLDATRTDTTVAGPSTQMTRWSSPSIEENPILVKRGDTYTLFTSRGWFRQCTGAHPYHSVFRQTKDLSRWPSKPRTLGFNNKIRTCGKGNATVNDGGDGKFYFTWNGHYPASKAGKSAPKSLYIGTLTWKKNGQPKVKDTL